MLETKTQSTDTSAEIKVTKSTKKIQKPNHKKWWIGGLVVALLFTIGGAVAYNVSQNPSKSQASVCKLNEKNANCINQKIKTPAKPPAKKPTPQIIKPVIPADDVNPYTGEKQ
jgi:hypothetical protein